MKKLLIIPLLLCILCLSACNKSEKFQVEYYEYFDTLSQITYYCSPSEAKKIEEEIKSDLKLYHELFDAYNEYEGVTNIATINKNQGETLEISPELYEILDFAKENYSLVNGKVNIASGALLSLWHDARTIGKALPLSSDISESLNHIDINNVELSKNTVTLKDQHQSLDLGSLAKGFICDKLTAKMKGLGVNDGFINMGGNVACFGSPPERDYFLVGVQNPNGTGLSATTMLKNKSMVTSGDYQRFYMVDSVKYHHIIDTTTGYPLNLYKSVSVCHESSAIADLLSTSIFLSSPQEGEELAKKFNAEVFWIFTDNSQKLTENFPIKQ